MKVLCYSQNVLERMLKEMNNILPSGTVLISIANTDSCCEWYKKYKDPLESYNLLPPSEKVLNLKFDDIAQDSITRDGYNILGLQNSQAENIVRFIDRAVRDGQDIIVHCLAGKSRSQGVVRYILDVYGRDLDIETNPLNPCITPNIHVTSKLIRAYERIFCQED